MKIRDLVLVILAACALAGCRQSVLVTPTSDPLTSDYTLTTEVEPENPTLGSDTTLVIAVETSTGIPVEGATVIVRGDMNHAGMQPVEVTGVTNTEGVVRIPFEWTMGGDWILTITATLPGDEVITGTVDVSVTS